MAKAGLHGRKNGWFKKRSATSIRGQMRASGRSRQAEFVCNTMIDDKGVKNNIGTPGKIVKIANRKYLINDAGSFERIE